MGCCSSKPSSDESAPNRPSSPHNLGTVATGASSNRNRTQQAPLASSASASNAANTHSNEPRSSGQQGDKNVATGGPFTLNPAPSPDKIKPPPNAQIVTSYAASLPPLTRSQLLKERRDFYDTRVSGTREAWSAMEYVCDLVERGDLDGAKSVLEAAGCSCPSGDLHGKRGGAYDDKGTRYVVPAWLLGEPEGTIKDEVDGEKTRVGGSEGEDDDDDEDEKKVINVAGPGKGKGKAVAAPAAKMLAVRARLSNTGRDVVVKFGEDETVGNIAVKIKEQAEMAPDARIKIMYLGKPLSEDKTLLSQGWQKDNTIIAFVFG